MIPSRQVLNVAHQGLYKSSLSSTTYALPTAPSLKFKEPVYKTASEAAISHITKYSDYQLPVYARPDFILSHGKGSYVWDTDGRRYLDFSAGIAVNALGHADEGVAKTISEQAEKLLHTSNAYHHEWAGKLAELLVTMTKKEGGLGFSPGGQASNHGTGAKIFVTNSGTEANEGALKIARKVGKDRWAAAAAGRTWDSPECTKIGIVCFEGSFHGRSMGSLSVTINPKYQAPFLPLVPGVRVGKLNQFAELETLIGQDTCAVILEPIQGEGGINGAGVEWLRAVRKRCDDVGAVLIYDEIQCGLYRTGTLWAHSTFPTDCHPDIITMAKPLGNGYPIGAAMIRDAVAATMTTGTHGTTFGGSPLACAVGHHILTRMSNPAFSAQIVETSKYLKERLGLLPKWFPSILQENIRGRGLILGLGFHDPKHPGRVVALARERGAFVLSAGKDAVRLVPSLNIGKEEVDHAVDVLEGCLAVMADEKQ